MPSYGLYMDNADWEEPAVVTGYRGSGTYMTEMK